MKLLAYSYIRHTIYGGFLTIVPLETKEVLTSLKKHYPVDGENMPVMLRSCGLNTLGVGVV